MEYHILMMENHTIFTKKVFEKLAGRKLSSGQPKILEYLSENDGAVQVDIAKACHIDPATVTSLLSRLEKNGLVERRMKEENRRYWYVYLTEAGRTEAEYVKEAFYESERAALDGFEEKEITVLLDYLQRIRENLS